MYLGNGFALIPFQVCKTIEIEQEFCPSRQHLPLWKFWRPPYSTTHRTERNGLGLGPVRQRKTRREGFSAHHTASVAASWNSYTFPLSSTMENDFFKIPTAIKKLRVNCAYYFCHLRRSTTKGPESTNAMPSMTGWIRRSTAMHPTRSLG